MEAMPAQKKTRPLEAKDSVSQTAGGHCVGGTWPPSSAAVTLVQRTRMLPMLASGAHMHQHLLPVRSQPNHEIAKVT